MPDGRLGIAKLDGLTGHQGHTSGYQTQTARRELDGTIIVVLTNITQSPDGELLAIKISELISRAIPFLAVTALMPRVSSHRSPCWRLRRCETPGCADLWRW